MQSGADFRRKNAQGPSEAGTADPGPWPQSLQHTRTRRKGSPAAAAPAEGSPAPGDPEWLGSTWLPPEAKREGKAPLHWFLMLMVGIHSGARPCGKAKMPSLVSSLSPRYRKEMGGLEVKQPAKATAEAPAASTTVRLLSEPRP